jgi:hypothetical protein
MARPGVCCSIVTQGSVEFCPCCVSLPVCKDAKVTHWDALSVCVCMCVCGGRFAGPKSL